MSEGAALSVNALCVVEVGHQDHAEKQDLNSMYYQDKIHILQDIFGTSDVEVSSETVRVGAQTYRIVDDVIILLPEEKVPGRADRPVADPTEEFSAAIQRTFGEEWKSFPNVLPDHEETFHQYFDQIDLDALKDLRVIDLGCGMGRWSYFVAPRCRELILVDFSEAIFVARNNLRGKANTIFFMGDVLDLPFREDAADLAFSLGVLHHTPVPALDAVRRLRRISRRISVYLYYALDNRPAHFRLLLRGVDKVRLKLSRIDNSRARQVISYGLAIGIYKPLIILGMALRPLNLSRHVPLYEGYRGKSLKFIRQDAYDRFFTSIEQRVSRNEIAGLTDAFSKVDIAETPPFWHFIVER